VDIGESEVTALEPIGELRVVDAQSVEERGVEVVDVDRVFHDVVTVIVGFPVHVTGFDSGTGDPIGEATSVVVATVVGLGQLALAIDGAAELSAPDHEGILEKSPLLEVSNECGAGLVDVAALTANLAGEIAVLIPAAVHELHEADAAFDHAPGEQTISCETAVGGILLQPIHLLDMGRFGGEVGEFRNGHLHLVRHFVLGDAGLDFRVAEVLGGEGIEFADAVEHLTAVGTVDAGRVGEIENGIAGPGAEANTLVLGGKETGPPHAGDEGLIGFVAAPLGDHDDEGGEVLVLGTDSVAEPGSKAGATGLLGSGLNVGESRVVIDGLGVHRLDEAEVISDGPDVGEQFAHPDAGFPVALEVEHGSDAGKRGLSRGHSGDALAHADGAGQFLAVVLSELRFVVVEVDVGRPSGHEEEDDPFRLGSEVEGLEHTVGGRPAGGRSLREEPGIEQRTEGGGAQAQSGAAKEMAPGQVTIERGRGIRGHGIQKDGARAFASPLG